MTSLSTDHTYQRLFVDDIFGSEASKEMGLVDASSTAGFDSLLGRREKCRQETVWCIGFRIYQPYFLNHMAQDMKYMTIANVREKVG